MKNKKHIVIVGGGLAGLTAAYYLLKKSNNTKVTIIESENRLGGRIFTPNINGSKIDVGAFLIVPFYKEFKKLVKELKLNKKIKKISDREFFHFYKEGWLSDKKVSLIKFFPFRFFLRNIKVFITGKINYYEPNLNLFQGLSLYELLKEAGTSDRKMSIINMIVEAYAYPNIKKISAAVVIPFSIKLIMHGMLNRSVVLSGGTSQVISSLESFILSTKRGKINISSRVAQIKNNKVVLDQGAYIKYDELIIATRPATSMLKCLADVKKTTNSIEYTHYDFITIKLKKQAKINGQSEWFGAYESVVGKNITKPHFSSFLKLSAVTDISDRHIGGYLKWPNNCSPENSKQTQKIAVKLVEKNLGIQVDSICNIQRWKFAMPNLDISEIEQYRKLQGKNSIWFAGDYLGLPSMDMAVYSGRVAAINILDKNNL